MRWHISLLIVCLAIAPLTAADSARVVTRGQPSCDAVPPSCEAPEPNCAAKPPCKPPCNPPPQQSPLYVQQPGVFVQPPASGTVQGPVEQSGIEGATITFPELSLRMPSIRFPGRSRTRQNARMIVDQQVAPYMEGPVTQAAPMAAQVAAAPAAAAPQMMMSPQMMAAPQMMMAPVQMAPQYYMPQQAPVQLAPPPAAQPMQVPQPERDVPPCDPRPSCDARGNPLAMSAEQEMRALEFAEQRLKQRLDVLRQQVEQLEMTQRPPTPTPDLGARAVQLPAGQPLRPVGNQQTQPISQPARPIAQPLPNTQPSYNERPVAYITEPQRLPQYPQQQYAPQYQPQQMQMPQSQVIREPQAPSAVVTGMRTK